MLRGIGTLHCMLIYCASVDVAVFGVPQCSPVMTCAFNFDPVTEKERIFLLATCEIYEVSFAPVGCNTICGEFFHVVALWYVPGR